MRHLIEDTNFKVGLAGVDNETAAKIAQRFQMSGMHDPGLIDVIRYKDFAECRKAVSRGQLHAICIAPEAYAPETVTAFITDIRVIGPLVSFCLVGNAGFLKYMPGYHKAWKEKFDHYYKLVSDADDGDFDLNAGVVRDLFVADSVKCRALGQYLTTPGAVIRLKSPRPYGFWLIVVITIIAALIGGAVGPIMDRLVPVSPPVDAAAASKVE